ncbi:hypothetical protein D1007_38502 [Hordeum vulgare]|nr:hypothetical protein D1007_38502 [Hordeum vulgare]
MICRVRLGKIPDRRATLSGRVSALENSMKRYANKNSEFVVKPEIGHEFDSLGEAYDFYNLYSWEIGFGIKLHRTPDHGWFIHDVKYEHNHGMAQTCGEKLHWASHRHIDAHAKDIVMHLRNNNISLSKTFGVIASFFGDMQNLPFNKRSLRYLCKRMNQQQGDDDIRKTIQLFSELKEKDPNFVDSVLVDEESKIRALMWTDDKSRH